MIIEDNEQTSKNDGHKRRELRNDAYLDDEINQKVMAQMGQETPAVPREAPETQLEKHRIKSRKSNKK